VRYGPTPLGSPDGKTCSSFFATGPVPNETSFFASPESGPFSWRHCLRTLPSPIARFSPSLPFCSQKAHSAPSVFFPTKLFPLANPPFQIDFWLPATDPLGRPPPPTFTAVFFSHSFSSPSLCTNSPHKMPRNPRGSFAYRQTPYFLFQPLSQQRQESYRHGSDGSHSRFFSRLSLTSPFSQLSFCSGKVAPPPLRTF